MSDIIRRPFLPEPGRKGRPQGSKQKLGGKSGRPSAYNPEVHPAIAFYTIFTGGTEEQVAKKCGVAPGTVTQWKRRYPEFQKSISIDLSHLLCQVSGALLNKAKGMILTDEEEIIEDVVIQKTGEIVRLRRTKKIIRNIPPDVGACLAILCNRDSKKWRRTDPPPAKEGDGGGMSPEEVARAMMAYGKLAEGIL